jgi:hypothetical protein
MSAANSFKESCPGTLTNIGQKTPAKKAAPKKSGRASRVIVDSDEDEEELAK